MSNKIDIGGSLPHGNIMVHDLKEGDWVLIGRNTSGEPEVRFPACLGQWAKIIGFTSKRVRLCSLYRIGQFGWRSYRTLGRSRLRKPTSEQLADWLAENLTDPCKDWLPDT